jgi:hypothetical protein
LGRLTDLNLCFSLDAETIDALGRTPLARRLRSLWVDVVSGETSPMLELVAGRRRFPALESLGLSECELWDAGFHRLTHSRHLPVLQELSILADQSLSASGVRDLLESPLWDRLRFLSLVHCPVGDEGARSLASALAGSRLRQLHLSYCGLTANAASALAGASSWGALEGLQLEGNDLRDAGAIALANSPHLAGLKELSLYSCRLTDAGARALAASPHADGLRLIRLYEGGLSLGARRALRKRFGDRFKFGHG